MRACDWAVANSLEAALHLSFVFDELSNVELAVMFQCWETKSKLTEDFRFQYLKNCSYYCTFLCSLKSQK